MFAFNVATTFKYCSHSTTPSDSFAADVDPRADDSVLRMTVVVSPWTKVVS